jgi:hypothetical protein
MASKRVVLPAKVARLSLAAIDLPAPDVAARAVPAHRAAAAISEQAPSATPTTVAVYITAE